MKKSTALIVNQMSSFEKVMPTNENVNLDDEALKKFNDVEQTFLRLVCFFEEPDDENFNLASIYKHLDDDWLNLALQAIHVFFSEDTYLMKKPTFSVIRESDEYKNQTQFAQYLKEHGLQYDRSKINVYVKRGIVPTPDLEIAGSKYWKGSTCEVYLKKEIEKRNKREN
ncbi:hypothetical protein [Halobacillus sp. A5]|uniref:hypothetical protein n=1 Tax=Halobacillus sp. A5 TaxID=2880263 RepID=UPI0020A6BB13|nr:hypothetical protein [Halobacillus sp. A5]MCP3029617.1 hypothetical protein [Halobacillus sp. A5]